MSHQPYQRQSCGMSDRGSVDFIEFDVQRAGGSSEPQATRFSNCPWPDGLSPGSYTSPSISSSGETPSSDLETCDSWSPCPRTPSLEHDACEIEPHYGQWIGSEPTSCQTDCCCHSSPRSDVCQTLITNAGPVSGANQFGNGIALRDLQQYPDTFSEDQFEYAASEDHRAEYCYYPCGSSTPIPTAIAYPESPPVQKSHVPTPWVNDSSSHKEDKVADARDTNKEAKSVRHTQYESPPEAPQRAIHASRCGSTTQKGRPVSSRVCKNGNNVGRNSKSGRVAKAISQRRANHAAKTKSAQISCPDCSVVLCSRSALHKHIATAHVRLYLCTFSLYGCDSTFSSKNEWKRHISSQHLRLGVWRCDIDSCDPKNTSRRSKCQNFLDVAKHDFNEFNRKDLFTQHIRRMHGPPKSCLKAEKEEFEASIGAASKRCWIDIRGPPPESICGLCANGDSTVCAEATFSGPESWDRRIEHIGRHLECRKGQTTEWKEDIVLRNWMVAEGLLALVSGSSYRLVGSHGGEHKSKKATVKAC